MCLVSAIFFATIYAIGYDFARWFVYFFVTAGALVVFIILFIKNINGWDDD